MTQAIADQVPRDNAGSREIGFSVPEQYNASRISDIVVALIWVGLVGYTLDRFVALLGRFASRGTAAS